VTALWSWEVRAWRAVTALWNWGVRVWGAPTALQNWRAHICRAVTALQTESGAVWIEVFHFWRALTAPWA